MRISPFGSITGPISLSTTPAIAVGRTRGQQHGEDAAARGADEYRRHGVERGHHREHVGELDLEAVIGRVAVVFG